ncbi:MAG: YbaB/EbfC family nucleoid-associated protein [Lysobacteraceae bacterium]
MKGQIGNMMQQVQRMQQDMQRAQEELANIEVEGQAGGGAVKVTMTARMDVRRVQIDPAMAGDDIEMLEDLIAAAMNDAVNKANQASSDKMSSVTSGLPIPPGMKIPGLF